MPVALGSRVANDTDLGIIQPLIISLARLISLRDRYSQYNLFRSVQIERNVFSEIVFLVLQFNTVNLGFDEN